MIGFVVFYVIALVAIFLIFNAAKYQKLKDEIIGVLNITENSVKEYDDVVIVKSRQALDNYDDLKYFKDNVPFDVVCQIYKGKREIYNKLNSFLEKNDFEKRYRYSKVQNELKTWMSWVAFYQIKVEYVTSAGNLKEIEIIKIDEHRIDYIKNHPEALMSKSEYNKLLKQQEKDYLDSKKQSYYDRVNSIIDTANEAKDTLIIKSKSAELEQLITKLYSGTISNIQKIKTSDSGEWELLDTFIYDIDKEVCKIVNIDKKIKHYYSSNDFKKIVKTCDLLMQSQKDFNDYISEKANSISALFGKRIERSETTHEDAYNYLRTFNKTINPFTAEVSATVFSSAENNPFGYIVKYFYPNRSQYPEQIEKLHLLISELETLREAKVIIENYKKEFDSYITEVPSYVLENDETGFYSRLGLAVIDESVLNVEYKFVYTSGGGMAQRSFTVPMTEENIIELIHQLENKLTVSAMAKQQRALMTSKLRTQIKKRDNYTCCTCGNSSYVEPNLLLEIDHIVPVSKGGLTEENNLQTLCWKCNRSKGARMTTST